MSEPKTCPLILIGLISNPKFAYDPQVKEATRCLRDACAMWRESKEMRYSEVNEAWEETGGKVYYCGLAVKP